MPIEKIHARQIFDSRGNPTVEVGVQNTGTPRMVSVLLDSLQTQTTGLPPFPSFEPREWQF